LIEGFQELRGEAPTVNQTEEEEPLERGYEVPADKPQGN